MSDAAELAQSEEPDVKRDAPVRRMTLGDGLILIAAIGIALGIARIPQSTYRNAATVDEGAFVFEVARSLLWMGVCLMIAVVSLRLIPPRPLVGSWIISAWLILAVSGGWRPEKSWIDRLGRAIGIGWIIVYFVCVCLVGLV